MLGSRKEIRNYILTELFHLCPYGTAVLKSKSDIIRFFGDWHPIRADETILYATRIKNSERLTVERLSFLEISIKRGDVPTFIAVVQYLARDRPRPNWPRINELLFQSNLIDSFSFSTFLKEYCVRESDVFCVADASRGFIFQKPCVPELAIIYDRPHILETSIKVLPEFITRQCLQDLLDICHVLQRKVCRNILSNHGIGERYRDSSISMLSQLKCLYYLLTHYERSLDLLTQSMTRLPSICEIVNSQYRLSYLGKHLRHPSQNNLPTALVRRRRGKMALLQFYLLTNPCPKTDVVKALVELGADIDNLFPSDIVLPVVDDWIARGDDMQTDPRGKTLLQYIVCNERSYMYHTGFRSLLELLIYENTSFTLNKSVVAMGLKRLTYIGCQWSRPEHGLTVCSSDATKTSITEGKYVMDGVEHSLYLENFALEFTVPLLIEAGFRYCAVGLKQALHN